MKTLIIDRTKWLRGRDADDGEDSYLLRERDGKMCCLGFYALQHAGKSKEDIGSVQTPTGCLIGNEWNGLVHRVKTTNPPGTVNSVGLPTEACQNLMVTNDDASLSEEKREEYVIKDFASIGVKVEFIN